MADIPTGETAEPRRDRAPRQVYARRLKRLVDLGLVVALLPIAAPCIAVLAAVVALDGHKPFYRQPRIGRSGRVFTLVKLRTMVPDADRLLARHLKTHPEDAAQWSRNQKLLSDPRVTRVGQVLRRVSVDELPQIWNVLIGDMSLVGPRPMMLEQQRLYPGRDYYDLRPGITGPWQVSQRHGSEFVSRAGYDRDYARGLSFRTDLAILGRTLVVVFRATGI